jgi:hypothetical protein
MPAARVFMFAFIFAASVRGQCASAACLGSTTADPLTITAAHQIADGAALDFGARHVILAQGGSLQLQGAATITCAKLTIQTGAGIYGYGDSVTATATAAGAHDGSIGVAGLVDFPEGDVQLTASGGVVVSGQIRAWSFGSPDCTDYGGEVHVHAGGDVSVTGLIDVSASHAGWIDVASTGGATIVSGTLRATTGGACGFAELYSQSGTIDVSAATTTQLTTTGLIDVTADSYGAAGAVHLAGDDVQIDGSILGQLYYLSWGGYLTVTADDDLNLAGYVDYTGGSDTNSPPYVTLTSGGDASISGFLYASGNYFGGGGQITARIGGALTVPGEINASLTWPFESCLIDLESVGAATISGSLTAIAKNTHIRVKSTGGDVAVSGLVTTYGGGYAIIGNNEDGVELSAAGDLTVSGSVVSGGNQIAHSADVVHRLTAGRTLTLQSGALVQTDVSSGNCGLCEGRIVLDACRLVVQSGAQIVTGGSTCGGRIEATAGDVLNVAGVVNASGVGGAVTLTTRLAAPFSPLITGSATPAPAIVLDAELPPCLANGLASFDAPTNVPLGGVLAYAIDSVPNAPIAVFAHASVALLPLGAFGWTQVDLFTALRLADHLGLFGPPIAATTDAAGHWSLDIPIPPLPPLAGFTVYAEAFVADAAALNGAFHQPPYRATTLN